MTRLQPWLIVFAAAVVATVGTALYSVIGIGGPLTIDQVPDFVTAHWRALPVPWLTFYGAAIIILISATALSGCRNVPHIWSAKEWAADFRYRLVATQYLTCLTFLLALGLAHFTFREDGLPADSRLAEIMLRFTPSAALAIASLLVWSIGSATVLFRTAPTTPAAAASPNLGMSEQRILRELERLEGLIERQSLPPLAAGDPTGTTVTALSEVVWAVHEDVRALLGRPASLSATDFSEAQAALDRSASELRATADLLQDLLRQLGETSSSLAPTDPSPRPSLARSELSQELKKLLEQMPPR